MSQFAVCAVFDIAAQFYHQPQCFRSTGAALRWFEDVVKNPEAKEIHVHPEHFQLFHIGAFDDFDASFVALEKPTLLIHATAFSLTS